MTDNTTLNLGSGGDVIATDDVTTLNGAASSGVKVQRVKVMYGPDNSATDVSTTNLLPVQTTPKGETLFRTTFAKTIASGVDTAFFTVMATGSGQTVAQSSGNLVLTTGTTINSETILRSTQSFTGSMIARIQTILSQRIINQNFYVELVDVIGDGLTASASSATALAVTFPTGTNPFTSQNVGQSMYVGNFAGGVTGVPGRYAIASVSGDTVNFTVAGFTVSSGTVSLFGWNYHQLVYNSTVATTAQYDTQRRGWNSGFTAATTNTTASPGHMAIVGCEDGNAFLSDQLVASVAPTLSVPTILRASRVVNLPDETANLYLQFRILNGSTAPASTTTWTIGMASVEDYVTTQVSVTNVKPQGWNAAQPVAITNTPSVNAAITSGTVTTVSAVTTVGLVSSVTGANLYPPSVIVDIAPTAITTTTTTAAFGPTFGAEYEVNIPVTLVSGTSPTLDVVVQESDDTGTNWYDVYHFPRITAVGMYRSPKIPLKGNRVRYVQTVGGTTPSFTRAINRPQGSWAAGFFTRRIFDRTLATTQALNSTTTTTTGLPLNVQDCTRLQMTISAAAITTTAPALQLQGSNDSGVSWISLGTPLTAVANSSVQTTLVDVNYELVRAIVTTAGSGATLNYVEIKGF